MASLHFDRGLFDVEIIVLSSRIDVVCHFFGIDREEFHPGLEIVRGVEEPDGELTEETVDMAAFLDNLNDQPMWAFADVPQKKIYLWFNRSNKDARPTHEQIIEHLAHELAHMVQDEKDYHELEIEAELVAAIAVKSYQLKNHLFDDG